MKYDDDDDNSQDDDNGNGENPILWIRTAVAFIAGKM
jgi:hypothetical protein